MRPESEKVEATLRKATGPLTVDDICRAIWKRVGARERNLVRVNLHRLDARGLLVRHETKYEIKQGGGSR